MNKNIINLARRKFVKLKRRYDKFINVGVDNWRGYRFILDTKDVRNCKNNCQNCELYNLLKNEKSSLFSATLYPANIKDKNIFGLQNILNCKTLSQYKNCYINFLVKACNTKKGIKEELQLINKFKIIYSRKTKNYKSLESNFKKAIINKALKNVKGEKKKMLLNILAKNKLNK